MSGHEAAEPSGSSSDDAWLGEVVAGIAWVAAAVIAVAIALPLLLPVLLWVMIPDGIITKAAYWRVHRAMAPLAVLGVAVVAGLIAYEVAWVIGWVSSGAAAEAFTPAEPDGNALGVVELGRAFVENVWPHAWPWALVNLIAGALLMPAAYLVRRRRLIGAVAKRRLTNVQHQAGAERARYRAMDQAVARRLGVRIDSETREVVGARKGVVRAPHAVRRVAWRRPTLERPLPLELVERQAIGAFARPTLRTAGEVLADRARLRAWPAGPWLAIPENPGHLRATLVAESSAGKTTLLQDIIAALVRTRVKVVFLDLKGEPDDAEDVAAIVRTLGATAEVGPRWQFFSGTADEITDRIVRLWPTTGGDGDHYRTEAEYALRAIQAHGPIRDADDLVARLHNPEPHTNSDYDTQRVTAFRGKYDPTTGEQAAGAFIARLRPILPHVARPGEGWTMERLPADVTVLPVSTSDSAELRVATAIFRDLEAYLDRRKRHSKRERVLFIIDEFPALDMDTDVATTAARVFERARSAGVGLIIAVQSASAASTDPQQQRRLFGAGITTIIGRSADPELVVSYAGTVERLERAGSPEMGHLAAGRSQHTYAIPPNHVREAVDGQFWIMQSGAFAQFRALAPIKAAEGTRRPVAYVDAHAVPVDAPTSPAPAAPPPEPVTAVAEVLPAAVDVDEPQPHSPADFRRTWDEE